jgi:hypothetical protein
MKYLLPIIFLLTSCNSPDKIEEKINTNILDMAFYSYQTGCYNEAQLICSRIEKDEDRSECFNLALDSCPKMAKQFRDWIATGKKE